MNKRIKLPKKIIITGGGSGGHISSAQAIIAELDKKYDIGNENFMYVGGDLGMEGEKYGNSLEKKVFKNANFNCRYIRAGKLQRPFRLKSIFVLLRTILGLIDSYKIVKNFRPDIVISTGGFVSVPICLIAKLFKTKIYIHEQTSTAGLSNRFVASFSEKVFLAYQSSEQFFKGRNTIHVGNLVRKNIFKKEGNTPLIRTVKKMMEYQDEFPIIYISGGSLGSHLLNETIREGLNSILNKYQIILQTGDNKIYQDYEIMVKERGCLDKHLFERFYPVKYIEPNEIGFIYNSVNLFIGRAGANTVYEIGVLGVPSIFIPIPWVTNNEQYRNALVLKNLGLSDILTEGELTAQQLVIKIDQYLKKKRAINKDDLGKHFPLNAEERILEEVGL
jgi:UDP-N-acetylglucosamine--N-acetylmuramyl-(pentapeptide) pyrophosphoryl-undecaprenol N-acetylglucosamine transferase